MTEELFCQCGGIEIDALATFATVADELPGLCEVLRWTGHLKIINVEDQYKLKIWVPETGSRTTVVIEWNESYFSQEGLIMPCERERPDP